MRPSVDGIIESALYVDDLDRSVRFYETLFGFRTIFRNQRLCAMSVDDRQVFLLFKRGASAKSSRTPGGVVPGHDGGGHIHIAFSISSDALASWQRWLDENKIAIESTVKWGRGGSSLYFRDPDRHVIELVTPGTWDIY
jgi:catechol 2,3-dioxygenase-like lactoylglutathione lyase family enzyme